jgi:hypothetical protein
LSENLVAPGIEPGTFESIARNSDHRSEEVEKITIIKYHTEEYNMWIVISSPEFWIKS